MFWDFYSAGIVRGPAPNPQIIGEEPDDLAQECASRGGNGRGWVRLWVASAR